MLCIDLPGQTSPVVRMFDEPNGMKTYFIGLEDRDTKCIIDYNVYTVASPPDVGLLRGWLADFVTELLESGAI